MMTLVVRRVGNKFIYETADPLSEKIDLELLLKGQVCNRVMRTSANGIPLRDELQSGKWKILHLDVGLCSDALGLSIDCIKNVPAIETNPSGISKQIAGQSLRTLGPFHDEPALYYWESSEVTPASIDYIVQSGDKLIPLEVKSGNPHTLKSLHCIMELKRLPLAVRINSDLPNVTKVDVKGYKGRVTYVLVSLPFYLIGEFHRLLDSVN